MYPTDGPLPSVREGRVQACVVHGGKHTGTDRFPHAHVVEVPSRDGGPHVGERVAVGQGCSQEVVRVVPVAEIASEGHVEHAVVATGRGRDILCGPDVVGPVKGEGVSGHGLQATTAGIGPQVTLAVHHGVKGGTILVGCCDVGGAYKRSHGPPTAGGERVGHPLQVVEHQPTHGGRETLDLVTVRLVQVCPKQFGLRLAERGHRAHIHTAHLQLHGRRQVGLIELPIIGHVHVHRIAACGVHAIVGPGTVQLSVVGIAWPGTLVGAVSIRGDVA